ncbi:hypothetical protein DNTS_013831 [Danionella cerebrum]|uniref:TNFR-Cys domain-containing protein n=1 Tax=Danionella cerebrum TaxID=2873325 RepID=A0A553PXV3_9TELE|nr:hypothetical protein DNTS_013831 [Danionella translucida]
MLSYLRVLFTLLIFSVEVTWTDGVESGCDDWISYTKDDVCCTRCKPGNRLVKRCGEEPEKLCTPCDPGMYVTKIDNRCYRCTQCTGIQITVKPCTGSSDAVCGCKAGFRCGDDKCSFCVTECKKGEEPTSDQQADMPPVLFAVGIAGLAVFCVVVSMVAFVKGRNTTKKPKIVNPEQDISEESRIVAEEQEDCSCRHPEQEQGGSSNSIHTQSSESKLLT